MKDIFTELHKEVIEGARGGNRSDQQKLFNLYSKAMFNTSLRMMGNVADAEDMTQEVFCEVFRKLDSFNYQSTFGAWLKRVTVNRCINELKRKKPDLSYVDEIPETGEETTNDITDVSLSVEKIIQAMDLLAPKFRIVFSLFAIEGYDHGEIAQILSISESTSKSQYHRAKKRIQEMLLTL